MKRRLLDCLAAIALAAAFSMATPALAFHGGFGGMHGGFGGMRGGMPAGRVAVAPMAHRFVGGTFGFRHVRHFHNVVVFGAPFAVYSSPYGYDDGCWRQVWTAYGWRWVYLC